MADVIRLIERAPGFSADNQADLCEWAKEWIDALAKGDYGSLRTLVLVVEDEDGQIATISQSLRPNDGARLVGLLQWAILRKVEGKANIEDLRK